MSFQNTFTVFNASAGSGKTFTLVKQYLLVLLKSNRIDAYKNILAITFTNKAVAEMKTRVIENLQFLTSSEGLKSPLMQQLADESGIQPLDIKLKADKILKHILHNYASFDISTIDRFTHKIIRSFARDLGIPVNFEVEMDLDLILNEAVDRVIDRAGNDTLLTKVLLDFTIYKTDEDKSWDISRDLFHFSKVLIQENHLPYILMLKGKTLKDFRDFSKRLKPEIKNTEVEIKKITEHFFRIVEKENLERLDFKSGSLPGYFTKLKNQNYKITWGLKWQTEIEEVPLYSNKVAPEKKQILDARKGEICHLFIDSRSLAFRREYLKEIRKNLTPLSLLSEISREIETIKKERSLVLISDFNPTIAAEINNQPAPFIYERLGERYTHYFIDEFQDTSEMQWQNMIPLIDHALSSEQFKKEGAGLTLVGDAKQSIYRFRGGKAEQFISLYGEENPFNIEKEVVSLPNNYRSAKEIVEFNNSFFSYVSETFTNERYKALFAASRQSPVKEAPGYVQIDFLEPENAEDELELYPQKVLEIIQNLEKDGISKSDICVLTRKRKESVAVAEYLTAENIPIVSSESLRVEKSEKVRFVNSILNYLVNPEDKNHKLSILNFLTSWLDIKNPYDIVIKNLELKEDLFFNWLHDYNIYFGISSLQAISLYETVETIIRSFQLIKTSDAYLQFYMDFVFEFVSKNPGDIPSFLEAWEQKKDKLSIVAPKTGDAVQVMTIHKSKGLEFPVVIYPFANSKLNDTRRDYLWLSLPAGTNDIPVGYFKASQKMLNWGTEEAEAFSQLNAQNEFDVINVLYVAFTRAESQLYILSNYDLDSKGSEYPNKVSGLLIGHLKQTGNWNDQKTYQFGEKPKSVNPDLAIEANHPKAYYSSATSNNAVQLVTKSGMLWGTSQESAINKGNLIHGLLENIKIATDLDEVFEKYKDEHQLSGEEFDYLKTQTQSVIQHSELKTYFSTGWHIETERDIISDDGEILRADRLNFNGNEVSILDYKTGNPLEAHKNQMEKYAAVLTRMDYKVVKKILVYINSGVKVLFV